MAEGGRIELTADMPGDHITGRANIAGYPARRTYACYCGGHGTSPAHTSACWRYYIARRVWSDPAVAEARAYLDALDAMWAEVDEAPRRPLSDKLRAVLAAIDSAAGAL